MSNVVSLSSRGAQPARVYFRRDDLRQIMDLFSRKVSANEWRDYSIDHDDGMAVFCIYRHSHDAPLFRIFKLARGGDAHAAYMITAGRRKLRQCRSLKDALSVFDGKLKLV